MSGAESEIDSASEAATKILDELNVMRQSGTQGQLQ